MSSVHHTTSLTPEQAINRLSAYYDGAVRALREAIAAFIERGEIPDDAARAAGGFVYPALHVSWDGEGNRPNAPAPTAALTIPATMSPPSPGRSYSGVICWSN